MRYNCSNCGSEVSSWSNRRRYSTPRCNICGKEICSYCSDVYICDKCERRFPTKAKHMKKLVYFAVFAFFITLIPFIAFIVNVNNPAAIVTLCILIGGLGVYYLLKAIIRNHVYLEKKAG